MDCHVADLLIVKQPGVGHTRRGDYMRFRILGGLEVVDDGVAITPTAPKLRTLLAVLLMMNNEAVSRSCIVNEIWGEEPPESNVMTLNTYVYHLRRLFKGDSGNRPPVVETQPNGYLAKIEPGDLDVVEFHQKVQAGRSALDAGDLAGARFALHQGLMLARGSVLAGVDCGPLLRGYVTQIEEECLEATQLRIDVDLACGLGRELVGELRSLISRHAFNESLHAQLMVALYRSERRGHALEVYRELRMVLLDELGIEPSPRLRQVHQDVLNDAAWLHRPTRAVAGQFVRNQARPRLWYAGLQPTGT